jgi:hypothetical protein
MPLIIFWSKFQEKMTNTLAPSFLYGLIETGIIVATICWRMNTCLSFCCTLLYLYILIFPLQSPSPPLSISFPITIFFVISILLTISVSHGTMLRTFLLLKKSPINFVGRSGNRNMFFFYIKNLHVQKTKECQLLQWCETTS